MKVGTAMAEIATKKIMALIDKAIDAGVFDPDLREQLAHVIIEDQTQIIQGRVMSYSQYDFIESLKFDYRVFLNEETEFQFESLSAIGAEKNVSHYLVSNNDLSFVGMFDFSPIGKSY